MEKKEEKKINEESAEINDQSRVYELGFLLNPEIEEKDIQKYIDSVKKIFSDEKGVFISEGSPKIIDLSYTIIKNTEGKNTKFDTSYFSWIKYEILPNTVEKIEAKLKKDENIIRFILFKTIKKDTLIVEKKPIGFKHGIVNRVKKIIKKEENVKKEEPKAKEEVLEKELDQAIDKLTKEE